MYKNTFLVCTRKVITPRRMRWEGYVARMEEVIHTRISIGKSERSMHLKGPRLSASIILKWILKLYGGKVGTEFIRFERGAVPI